MWTLSRLVLSGFKAYRDRTVLELEDGIIVFQGRVGAGKSSIFQAVEFALYGSQLEIKERIAKLVDLISEGEGEARVELWLRDGDKLVQVARTIRSSGREGVSLKYDGLNVVRPSDAYSLVTKLLGVDEDEFERIVLISHRVLEGIILGAPHRRSLEIDKIFGIDVLQNLVNLIPIKKLSEVLEREKSKLLVFGEFKDLLDKYGGIAGVRGKLDELNSRISKLEEDRRAISSELSRHVRKRLELLNMVKGVEALYGEYVRLKAELGQLKESIERYRGGIELNELVILSHLDTLHQGVKSVVGEVELLVGQELVDLVESVRIAPGRIGEALGELSHVLSSVANTVVPNLSEKLDELKQQRDALKSRVESLEGEVRGLENKLKALERNVRRARELEREVGGDPRELLRRVKGEYEAVASRNKLLSSAMSILDVLLSEGSESYTCPVCGLKASREQLESARSKIVSNLGEVASRYEELRKRVEELEPLAREYEGLMSLVEEYESCARELDEKKRELESIASKLLRVEKSIADLERKLNRLKPTLSRLGRTLNEVEEAWQTYVKLVRAKELERRVRELEGEIRGRGLEPEEFHATEITISSLEAKLRELEGELEELSKERERLKALTSRVGSEELDEVLARAERVEDLVRRLERVRESFVEVQSRVRDRIANSIRGKFNEIFSSLYPYDDLAGAELEITQVGGKSRYEIYALTPSKSRRSIAKLSDGQRLALALALVLSMRLNVPHNVGFMVFDEPIPFMDKRMQRLFAEIVVGLQTKGLVKQIMVATHMRDFAEVLTSRALESGSKVTYVEIERLERKSTITVKRLGV